MIAKLKGIIDNIGEDCCIIDVNGVGYLVNMSSRSLSRLQQGEYTALLIETVIKEDSITLFGFQPPWEKEWFNTLTKIQGVGGKVCLNILSFLFFVFKFIITLDEFYFYVYHKIFYTIDERVSVKIFVAKS